MTTNLEKALLDAEEITDKQELLKLTNNKELVLVHMTTLAPWDAKSTHRVPSYLYYADKEGKVFKYLQSSEPIKYNHGNRFTVETEAEALVMNIKNFFKAIAQKESENEIDRGLTKTRHPQEKLMQILLKKKKTEAEAQNEFDFILFNSTLDSLTDVSQKFNTPQEELLSTALNVPQMETNLGNTKFKLCLEAINLELDLTNENEKESEN